MGKNNNDNKTSSKSLGVCEKLFTAFKVSPAFQAIRRISYRPSRDPTPTDGRGHRRTIEIKSNSAPSDHHHQQQKTGKTADHVRTVPIKLVSAGTISTTTSQNSNTNNNAEAVEKDFSKKNDVVASRDERKPDDHDPINATFTDFINRVGSKIRTMPKSDGGDQQKKSSGPDHGGMIKEKGSFKDHFSDYIHRTKVKIASPAKSAPNNSTGKSVSFKKK